MVAISSLSNILTYAISLCGVIPLFPWLTPAPRMVLIASFLAGIWQDRRGGWTLKPWMQNSAIVPVFLYYLLQFSRHNPVQPVVSVLAIMLAVRLCGEKSIRHSLQIHALALFCLASSSLFDLSPLFLVYVGLLLFLVAVALVLMTFINQDNSMRLSMADLQKVLAAGLLMPLLSLPLMVFFFPLLPRTQLPLLNFLSSPGGIITGLADKVDPGSYSSIGESRVLSFRAEMPRQLQQLYWRGIVFNQMEGNRWIRDRAVPAEEIVSGGRKVTQTIYPEPSDSKALIALDRPISIVLRRMNQAPDGVFEYTGSARRRLIYSAESAMEGVAAPGRLADKSYYLRLPPGLPVRFNQLAADIRRKGKDDLERVELLEKYFRNGGYRYSTRDLPTGNHAIERFMFETRRGHCEFYASAFAMLLRSAGIPCRLVGGYLGGDYNELGGYYLVTENMAHVWVEVYISGRGWLRVDPSSFAENAGNIFGARNSGNSMQRLRLMFDSVNHAWNRTVIPYDFERQLEFANNVGKRFQGIDPARSLGTVAPYLAVIVLFLGLALIARRTLFFRTREERILRNFLLQAERDYGFGGSYGRKGLFEMAGESGNENMLAFVRIYAGAIYRDRKLTDEEYRQLKQILREGFGKVLK